MMMIKKGINEKKILFFIFKIKIKLYFYYLVIYLKDLEKGREISFVRDSKYFTKNIDKIVDELN